MATVMHEGATVMIADIATCREALAALPPSAYLIYSDFERALLQHERDVAGNHPTPRDAYKALPPWQVIDEILNTRGGHAGEYSA